MSLTEENLNKLQSWKYKVIDNSITTKLYKNFWHKCQSYISPKISPNVLSITGLLCLISNFILSLIFYETYPLSILFYVSISTQIYCHLDAIDGIHARNTKTSSPLGELVDHICDTIGLIFIVLTFCNIYDISNINTQTYLCIASMLVFQSYHMHAYLSYNVEFGKFSGPTEMLTLYSVIILLKPFINIDMGNILNHISIYIFIIVFVSNIYIIYNKFTKHFINQLILYTLYSIISVSVYNISNKYNNDIYYLFNICLNICAITCDFIISKMSEKNLSIINILLIVCARFNNIFGIIISMYYIINYLMIIANHMKLNLIYHNLTSK